MLVVLFLGHQRAWESFDTVFSYPTPVWVLSVSGPTSSQMQIGVDWGEVGLLATTVWSYLQTGLGLSLLAYPVLRVSDGICQKVGCEPLTPETFQEPFETFCDHFFHPIEQRANRPDHSSWGSKAILKGAVAATVISFAVILEVVSLSTVAGISIAGAHLMGWEVEFTSLGYKVVALIVLLMIALMEAGHDRIDRKIEAT